jgi:predicted AlkP superfamily phosphohydrolase/phosphomutase
VTHVAPLVVLGLDAGDPAFIERWVAEGRLPAIASLMERGSHARTCGPELVTEHGVWVSLFSGVSRGQHGYFYFRQLRPGSYDLEARTGLDIDAPPFWTRLARAGRRVALIDIPDNVPDAGVGGLQLANWATHNNWDPHHFPTASEPPGLLAEVEARHGRKLLTVENHHATVEEDRRLRSQLLEQTRRKGELCRDLLLREPFDAIVTVFAATHAANHQFWQYRPEIGERRDDELAHAIRDVYEAVDAEIGRMLERLPADANVFVVSSVGMEDDFPTTGLTDAFCRRLGYQSDPPPGGFSWRPLDLARRLVPERVRLALSRRLSREVREGLLADQFRSGTDWSRTRAFALPASYTSFLRVNLRGREPAGTVAPGAEYERVLRELESDLAALRDVTTGEPVVARTRRAIDLFGADAHPALPDLFVEWIPGRFLERVRHPRCELSQGRPEFFRRSDHSSAGFVAAAGPGIRRGGALGEVDVLDLAPTFLALLGEAPGPEMGGRVLEALSSR